VAIGRRIGRFFLGLVIVLGLTIWVVALLLFSDSAELSDDFANNLIPILAINAIGVSVLIALIVRRLVRLVREYRRFVPGSRLEARVVTLVVLVAAAPLVVLYLFSMLFISKSIDDWIPDDVNEGVREALDLAVDQLGLANLVTLNRVARDIEPDSLASGLAAISAETGVVALAAYAADGSRLVVWPESLPDRVPLSLGQEILDALDENSPSAAAGVANLEPLPDEVHEIRAAVRIDPDDKGSAILLGFFPLDAVSNARIRSVRDNNRDLALLETNKPFLELAFITTLSLVVLVAILAAVYTAFAAARRLVSPIQQLMQGTRAVARGDFDTKVPLAQRDEIGFLVNSFNNMTQRLAAARQEAYESEQRLEEERSKLALILARLSSGVVALEPDLTIRTANSAAGEILGVDLEAHVGESLIELAKSNPLLDELTTATAKHLDGGRSEWREQISLHGELGSRELVCACTALPAEGDEGQGFIIVFDDITALIRAQREAAWGEVARRLAHEIKNPLTPIQLSAERLRRRYLLSGDTADLELLDRATHTIIQQVDSMKGMVDAFSEYARAPDIELAPLDLNAVIAEVTELYRHQVPPVSIEMQLDENLPEIEADIGRLRQIMHNLMRNASEAIEGQADAEITVTTRRVELEQGSFVEILVSDNGPGFAAEIMDQVFLPYVTSKAKGTGLGLAIVRKLVEEHGGQIRAGNRAHSGAEVSILLPLPGAGRSTGSVNRAQQGRRRA
jgi:nitrogen fixation/metabolism regulation signal transduction histidine kinase